MALRKLLISALLATVFAGCELTGDGNEINVRLEDGRSVTVYLEEETFQEQKILVVDYRSDTVVRRENDVEREVNRIWETVRSAADERGYAEALIKYRQPDPDADGSGEYAGLLFEAEKIENGSWKLRKVN